MTAEAAAALLGTTTGILILWEERYGYPVAQRSEDGQPLYPDEMVLALRDALHRECSIASAIGEAQRAQAPRRRRRRPPAGRHAGFPLFLERRSEAR